MMKKILSVLAAIFILSLSFTSVYAEPAATSDAAAQSDANAQTAQDVNAEGTSEVEEPTPEEIEAMAAEAQAQQAEESVPAMEEVKEEKIDYALYIKSSSFSKKDGKLALVVANKTTELVSGQIILSFADATNSFVTDGFPQPEAMELVELSAGGEKELVFEVNTIGTDGQNPVVNMDFAYGNDSLDSILLGYAKGELVEGSYDDILNVPEISKTDAIVNFLKQTGFSMTDWKSLVMILISCILFYLAIVKKFEPLLLLPIAFGMLLTNLMGAEVFHEELFAGGHVHWDLFGASNAVTPGLIDILYLGVKLGIYPCLIFVGVGAMTDFGPLIANPKSLLLGAAAQVGIFATFLGALALGFTSQESASIGIIGGADGPTAIFVTSKLAPHLLGPIAVAAYSYMALVPVIQPPIMKLLTTKKERQIEMKALRTVSQKEKIIFPIVVTIFVALLVPSAAPLVGCLMLGNLLKECGVCERLSKTVQNELMNIVTVFLGISVGATATASTFLSLETIKIIVMGVVAFGVATAGGVLLAKFMNLFLKNKINPLIGSAGVSAVPMAARVSQVVGQKENPSNFLLMHAMGPNVAGVIGSAIAAGALIAMLG